MGINFNGGTMLGTFNAQATFMQNAMMVRPLAPMPMSVRTVSSAYSSAPGRLAQLAPKPARVAVGPLASRGALPVGSSAIEHARGLGAPAAIVIGAAALLSGCEGVTCFNDVSTYLGMFLLYGSLPALGLGFLVRDAIRHTKKERILKRYGKKGIEGVKDAIRAGHSPGFLGKEGVFGRGKVIKVAMELLVDEEVGLLTNGGDRKRRALAFKNVKRRLEALSARLDWDVIDTTLKAAMGHI